jgi:hypothetical protein
VIQIFKNLQTLLNDGMAFTALDIGHKADATGIVFIGRIVHALSFGHAMGPMPNGGGVDNRHLAGDRR